MTRNTRGSFLKAVICLIAVILILASYDVTLRDLLSLNWTTETGNLLIKFFTQ